MKKNRVGILHPGEMGESLAATLRHGGCEVYWASAGRSAQTAARAQAQALLDAGSLQGIAASCEFLVSVCPPHGAEALAESVAATGFRGLYLDANAIAPARARRLGEKLRATGADFVDGGIIGGPAWEVGRTWLVLSGERAPEAAAYFAAGPLETEIISERIGDASALKLCFAANTKGQGALLCAVLAAAEGWGLRPALERQWRRRDEAAPAQAAQRVRGLSAKAWRFAGEMEEIADFLAEAGLPSGFHEAAAIIYRRIAHLKDEEAKPPLANVLMALLEGEGERG